MITFFSIYLHSLKTFVDNLIFFESRIEANWGSSIYDVHKKEQIVLPPPPLTTTVQFEGTLLPETDSGRPNFYHPPPLPVIIFSKIFQEIML